MVAVVLLAPVLVVGGVLRLVVPGIRRDLLRDHGLPGQRGLPQVGAVVAGRAAVGRGRAAPHIGLLRRRVHPVGGPGARAADGAGRAGGLVDVPGGVLMRSIVVQTASAPA